MIGSNVTALLRLRRTLAAVYRFHDVFYHPFDDRTPPVRSPLAVSIPSMRWGALRVEEDATYRFSALTLPEDAPVGSGLLVEVTALNGDYVSHEPIQLDLPLSQSVPPQRTDFLIVRPLWPTIAFRPPPGETALRGRIYGPEPVTGLKVIMNSGAPSPAGDPYTLTDDKGEFLFRFPLLRGTTGGSVTLTISVSDGGVPVDVEPLSITAVLGETKFQQFERM